ncbi:uncharacterized protein [Spinacia oleracea]|uniref:BED-type domain-containing protein n=1 Tax=Spinacia oleracea TaxID=3562 RepID=A0ABM3QX25_SPIOL|nr:uncharacterized protein LOC130462945 [Spinacia oleracea]
MASKDEDIGWKFGEAVDGNKRKVKCKFCHKIISGGITRLKQHLAHKSGDVAPCGSVSVDVKREIMALLMQTKDKKTEKNRMTRDFEDEIVRSMNRPIDDDDDDDDDPELEYALRQSRTQHQFDHTREAYEHNRSGFYDRGGSSGYIPPQMTRSFSVGVGRGRNTPFEPASSPLARLRAREIELEKDCTNQKQSKLSTSFLKKAKKSIIKAFGNFMIDANLPFRAIESPYTNPLMDTIRACPNVRAPSAYDIAQVYLPDEVKEMKE